MLSKVAIWRSHTLFRSECQLLLVPSGDYNIYVGMDVVSQQALEVIIESLRSGISAG